MDPLEPLSLFSCHSHESTCFAVPPILGVAFLCSQLIDFDLMADSGLTDDEDRQLIQFADTALEAWELIREEARMVP